ncbi:MAG: NAD(P)-dependent oxidoreductase [Bacteroidales bacterium]
MKVLVATEKPFAKAAVDGIRKITEGAGFQLSLLEKYSDVNDLYKAVADADALIVRSDKVTKEVIDHAKNLKIVVRAGAGYDNLDLAACTAHNIVAMNTPGQNSNAVAELAVGMMIYMYRNTFKPGTGMELKGKKLGIHAYGHVGRNVARIAKCMGMEVFAYAIRPKATMKEDGVTAVASAEELYSTCDVISLHIPSNKDTAASINYALLNRMPKGALLVNTARKEVINEADLVKLMNDRPDFKYATDVMPVINEELNTKFAGRYFATPKKMGAETAEANVNAGLASASQIVNFLKNGDKTFQVNK